MEWRNKLMGRNLNITVIIKSNSLFLLFAGISFHFLPETSSLKTLKDTKVDFQWKCKHLGKSFFEQIELSDSMDWIICLLRSRYEGWGLTQWHNDTGVRCEVRGLTIFNKSILSLWGEGGGEEGGWRWEVSPWKNVSNRTSILITA